MGIGSDNCIAVKADEFGKMDVEDLEKKINESLEAGSTPFIVTATAGTTVFGAFDPIVPVANLCKKYNLWLHVDAAWGGGALMSKKHRHLLNGIELYVLLINFNFSELYNITLFIFSNKIQFYL